MIRTESRPLEVRRRRHATGDRSRVDPGRLQGIASSAGSVASIVGLIGGGAAFETLGKRTFLVAVAALLAAGAIFLVDRARRPRGASDQLDPAEA